MRRAIIHIGTPKTGSTVIQKFLAANERAMADVGYHVPMEWGPNHFGLLVHCYEDWRWDEMCFWTASRIGRTNTRPTQSVWRQTRLVLAKEWRKIARARTDETLILSNEHLYVRLKSEADLRRFSSILARENLDPEFVVYVRDPLSHAISALSTRVRAGFQLSRIEVPRSGFGFGHPKSAWNFAMHLSRWESVFPGRIRVRLYEPRDWPEGELLRDFCQAIGVEWSNEFKVPARANEALSWSSMRILNALNATFPLWTTSGELNVRRGPLPEYVATFDPWGIGYRPSAVEIASYREQFADSNEWLRRRYFPNRRFLWSTLPKERDPEMDYKFPPSLTDREQNLVSFIENKWDERRSKFMSSSVPVRVFDTQKNAIRARLQAGWGYLRDELINRSTQGE